MEKTFNQIWEKNKDKNLNKLDFLLENEEIGFMSKQTKTDKLFVIKCKARDLQSK